MGRGHTSDTSGTEASRNTADKDNKNIYINGDKTKSTRTAIECNTFTNTVFPCTAISFGADSSLNIIFYVYPTIYGINQWTRDDNNSTQYLLVSATTDACGASMFGPEYIHGQPFRHSRTGFARTLKQLCASMRRPTRVITGR